MTEQQEWQHYTDLLRDKKIFSVCKNKTVLEMGPHMGALSELIKEESPERHLLVEPNCEMKDYLKDYELFTGTYNQYVEEKKERFDVVVCCGVIYHMHSPFDMIEKVITINQPETFILESINVSVPMVTQENVNVWGGAFDTVVPYNINVPLTYIKNVLSLSDYSLEKEYVWRDFGVNHHMKWNMQMMVFQKD